MRRMVSSCGILAGMLVCASLLLAQNPGETVYKSKCMHCHGVTGLADTSMGKTLKVKPITDPAVKKMSLKEMVDAVRNGMGKMQPYKGSLSEMEIKESTEFFRAFSK